jgi:hypothetical protein
MSTECTHILPNGQKCRCAATRNQKFCRHHGAKTASGASSIPKRDRYSRIRRWSGLNRMLPSIRPADIPLESFSICLALLEDGPTGISDREAGRLLRGLFRRFGSVPFPLPPDPDTPPAAAVAVPQKQYPVVPENSPLTALMAKLGPGVIDTISDEDLLKAWSELASTQPSFTSTRPGLISTRPSSHATQPRLNQTRLRKR